MTLLKFSMGNAKLSKRLIFNLPSGYSCPGAGVCKTMADRTTGKIMDLPQLTGTDADEYRCFSAMAETRPSVREARWHNWDLIRQVMYQQPEDALDRLTNLIETSIDSYSELELTRVHEAGDYWTDLYMQAWFNTARNNSRKRFYSFTKSLGMWIANESLRPDNYYLTASHGGTSDYLIPLYKDVFKRIAYVVYTEEEAVKLGLEIDHDDSHCFGDKPFALLVHGSQRAGSAASKAISQRKKEGKFIGYNAKHKVAIK